MLLLLFIAFLVSTDRRHIRLRTVVPALLTQVAIGALVLFVPAGKTALAAAANGVNHVLSYGNEGVSFLFGGLNSDKMFALFGGGGFVFAVRVLPMIVFVTALISVLYYLGVMRWGRRDPRYDLPEAHRREQARVVLGGHDDLPRPERIARADQALRLPDQRPRAVRRDDERHGRDRRFGARGLCGPRRPDGIPVGRIVHGGARRGCCSPRSSARRPI